MTVTKCVVTSCECKTAEHLYVRIRAPDNKCANASTQFKTQLRSGLSSRLWCKSAKDKTVQSGDSHFEFCLHLLFVIYLCYLWSRPLPLKHKTKKREQKVQCALTHQRRLCHLCLTHSRCYRCSGSFLSGSHRCHSDKCLGPARTR